MRSLYSVKSDRSSHEDALDLVLEFQTSNRGRTYWKQGTLEEGTFHSPDFLKKYLGGMP